MALTVKDVLNLKGLSKMHLVAGKNGTNRIVSSLGIADNEFASFADKSEKEVFEPNMFILSTLLFAKNRPDLLLSAVKYLYEIGASAFACKTSIYSKIPMEVTAFANLHDFPIIQYDSDLYMESIIFEILDAIRREDDNFFSEENIDHMIDGSLTRAQIYTLIKNISLNFKEYAMAVYIKSESSDFESNLARYSKAFYLNHNLSSKALICQYKKGLFATLTAHQENKKSFQIILKELIDFLSPSKKDLFISCSRIHDSYKEMDLCIRESYYTYIASLAEQRNFESFDKIGTYQVLIPLSSSVAMKDFCNSWIHPLIKKNDYFETINQLVLCDGDIFKTASALQCHHNTIRYRISKIKQLLSCDNISDQEFYVNITLAMRLFRLDELEK